MSAASAATRQRQADEAADEPMAERRAADDAAAQPLPVVVDADGCVCATWAEPGATLEPEAVVARRLPELRAMAAVAIAFPKFTDGRGYSHAARLREAGFTGEIHAVGDVIAETIYLMRRVGFTHFHLRPGSTTAIDPATVRPFAAPYQGAQDGSVPRWAQAGAEAREAPVVRGDVHLAALLVTLDMRLRGAAAAYGRVALAFSAQAEDTLLLWRIAGLGLAVDAFLLDTGKLHDETRAYALRVTEALGVSLKLVTPDPGAVLALEQRQAPGAIYESLENRKRCCAVRKVEPLKRHLGGFDAWITGVRREQSPTRESVELEHFDEAFGIAKFNPLADWTSAEIQAAIGLRGAPEINPLHARGYPSIGCEPCTRAVRPGEDPRAGRWWWEQRASKECGLHQEPAGAELPVGFASPARASGASVLDDLIDESIHVIREAAACERPAILFSGGKDSVVVAWLARMAFAPARVPMPLLHIDTGHNFEEIPHFRDAFAAEHGFELIVASVADSIARGTVRLGSATASRNEAQAVTLLEAIEQRRFGALLGGARRDEERSRAKERVFSHRDSFGQWDPKVQRPELWDLYNTRVAPGEHLRVFPISNWNELDLWEFIAREEIRLPSLYYAHLRRVLERHGRIVPVTPLTPPLEGETPVMLSVRFRTVGDMSCTCPVRSDAADAWEVLAQTRDATTSERGETRLDDLAAEAAMEQRKRQGYF